MMNLNLLHSVASNWIVTYLTVRSRKFTNAYMDYFALIYFYITSKLYNPLLSIFCLCSGDSRAWSDNDGILVIFASVSPIQPFSFSDLESVGF